MFSWESSSRLVDCTHPVVRNEALMLIMEAVKRDIKARIDLQDRVVHANGGDLVVARIEDCDAAESMSEGCQAVAIPVAQHRLTVQ